MRPWFECEGNPVAEADRPSRDSDNPARTATIFTAYLPVAFEGTWMIRLHEAAK
jgi:hypothetical protein